MPSSMRMVVVLPAPFKPRKGGYISPLGDSQRKVLDGSNVP